MARAAPKPSNDSPRDAVTLLKADHHSVEQLFDRFEAADDDELDAIATRICQLLSVHAQIEEEMLYPAAREAFEDEEDIELVSEALVEHGSAKELISKIEAMTSDSDAFKATVKVLSEYIKHHVKEEEKELFPKLKQTELDLKELGAQLSGRRLQLMEEMGVEEEEPARTRSGGSRMRSRPGGGRRSTSRSPSRSSARSARH